MRMTLYAVYVLTIDNQTGATSEALLGSPSGGLWVTTSPTEARMKIEAEFGPEAMSSGGTNPAKHGVAGRYAGHNVIARRFEIEGRKD